MNIQAEISWIQAELAKVTDRELIMAFKNLLKYRAKQEKTDWWDELSKTEKAEIEEGIKQADKGEFISHEEVMANPKKWL
jgi:predicted transcriptional regulator